MNDQPREPGEDATEALRRALRMVVVHLPHLAGLTRRVRLAPYPGAGTIGVFASGRIVFEPDWILGLSGSERTFVVAHELLHLALLSHERGQGEDARLFNIAHDFIINDMLEDALGLPPPAGGLRRCGARYSSVEQIVLELKRAPASAWEGTVSFGQKGEVGTQAVVDRLQQRPARRARSRRDSAPSSAAPGALGEALRAAGLAPEPEPVPEPDPAPAPSGPSLCDLAEATREDGMLDVLSRAQERLWFPDATGSELAQAEAEIRQEAASANAVAVAMERVKRLVGVFHGGGGRGDLPGARGETMEALRTTYRPPWQQAMQVWIEGMAAGARSYARPSRRQPVQPDIVLAGRRRDGFTLNIVLDTSGSMVSVLPALLGIIGNFCDIAGVEEVRLMQCDTTVTADERLHPLGLLKYRVKGFGGSDMSPALQCLAQDPAVESVLVLTDGYISYPRDPPPMGVYWGVHRNRSFKPRYGQVVHLPDRLEAP
ncbi:MAG: VWA-like domain-containing protein [Pseudomonadota bacterium]